MAARLTKPAVVTVLARSPAAAAEVACISGAKAALGSVPVTFTSAVVDYDRADEIERAVGAVGLGSGPDVVVHCVSPQSPWEMQLAPSAWTDLVANAGFGVTLPLQALFVLRVAEVLRLSRSHCVLINGCFPDAVNPVLGALGLPVFSGIGNVATLAAGVLGALSHEDRRDVRLLAHHVHLHAPVHDAEETRVWVGSAERADAGALLAPIRSVSRTRLNVVAGHTGAQLVSRVLDGSPLLTNLPGPLGLPGGYPVRVAGRRIELRLPGEVSLASAMAWNQRAAARDGVVVDSGRISFPPRARSLLGAYLPDVAEGFPATDIKQMCAELRKLRSQLRQQPPRAVDETERGTDDRTHTG